MLEVILYTCFHCQGLWAASCISTVYLQNTRTWRIWSFLWVSFSDCVCFYKWQNIITLIAFKLHSYHSNIFCLVQLINNSSAGKVKWRTEEHRLTAKPGIVYFTVHTVIASHFTSCIFISNTLIYVCVYYCRNNYFIKRKMRGEI